MGRNSLDTTVKITVLYRSFAEALEQFGDDYAWMCENYTEEKEAELINKFINKLVDISV